MNRMSNTIIIRFNDDCKETILGELSIKAEAAYFVVTDESGKETCFSWANVRSVKKVDNEET